MPMYKIKKGILDGRGVGETIELTEEQAARYPKSLDVVGFVLPSSNHAGVNAGVGKISHTEVEIADKAVMVTDPESEVQIVQRDWSFIHDKNVPQMIGVVRNASRQDILSIREEEKKGKNGGRSGLLSVIETRLQELESSSLPETTP